MSEDLSIAIDFYVGRGADAQYLGTAPSAPARLAPGVFQRLDQDEYTERQFRSFVGAFVSTERWPHPYASSDETSWTYAYDKGSVYVYHYGVEMVVIRCNAFRTAHRNPNGRPPMREWRPVNRFPAMASPEASR